MKEGWGASGLMWHAHTKLVTRVHLLHTKAMRVARVKVDVHIPFSL